MVSGWKCCVQWAHWHYLHRWASAVEYGDPEERLPEAANGHHLFPPPSYWCAADARGNAQKCPCPLPPTPSFCTQDELRGSQASSTACVKPSAQMSECCAGTGAWTSCVLATCWPWWHQQQLPEVYVFYDSFVAIDLNKCTALEHVTLEQSSSHLWHDSRKVRIAASTAKVPIRGNPQTFIREHLYPQVPWKCSNSPRLRKWGICFTVARGLWVYSQPQRHCRVCKRVLAVSKTRWRFKLRRTAGDQMPSP